MVSERPNSNCQTLSSYTSPALQLLEEGEYTLALQLFMAFPRAMQDPDNLINQAVCLIHLGQAQKALQRCDRALLLSPNHSQAWLFKGVALHRLDRYKEAYICYDRALGKPYSPCKNSFLPNLSHGVKGLKSLVKYLKDANVLRLWLN